jgi:DNA-directed RNA polymerase subunit H (RpoH/RPB5)
MNTIDVIKLMLRQRGVNTDSTETIESDFPAVISKIDKVFIYMSNRSRISDKDIDTIIGITQKNGGDLSIVVVPIQPSSTIMTALRQKSDKIQLFHVGQLQFDITTHRKVPSHRILSKEEVPKFTEKYHIPSPSTLMPMLDSQDPMAKWIGAKPGDIIEIMRKSETAGTTPYYRYCVADVTL